MSRGCNSIDKLVNLELEKKKSLNLYFVLMYFSSCFIHSIGEWLELRRIIHLRFDLLKKKLLSFISFMQIEEMLLRPSG